MRRDRPEPLIFAFWHRALERRLFADELGDIYDDWAGVTIFGMRPVVIARALRDNSDFCDDVSTSPVEDCETQIAMALEDALEEISAAYGEQIADWRWGDAHKAWHDHRPFGQVPGIAPVFAREIENGGGVFTINVGTYNPADPEHPWRQIVGPSLRMIVPLDDPGQAQFMIPTGQSGNRLSEHYDDLLEPWRDGVYLPIPMTRTGVDSVAVAKRVLRPID
jgi:penicillin amidase